jgi:hypothetical protein
MIRIIMAVLAVIVLLLPATGTAGQSSTAKSIDTQWARSDKCNREAIAKFPDHTAEALEKREKYVHSCNLRYSVPARSPLSTPSN